MKIKARISIEPDKNSRFFHKNQPVQVEMTFKKESNE